MATKRFFWSSVLDCVLQEQDGAGQTQVTYTHEPALYGPLVSENRGGQKSQYHFDALGSTRALTGASQTVADALTFDAFGNLVARSGISETPYNWVGCWGYQNDSATTGWYYVQSMFYEPVIARWMSALATDDVISGSASSYTYSNAAPTLLSGPVLPTRHLSWEDIQGLIRNYIEGQNWDIPRGPGQSCGWICAEGKVGPCKATLDSFKVSCLGILGWVKYRIRNLKGDLKKTCVTGSCWWCKCSDDQPFNDQNQDDLVYTYPILWCTIVITCKRNHHVWGVIGSCGKISI